MKVFLSHRLRDSWLSTLLFAGGMAAYALLIVSVYGTIRDQAAAFDELLKSYPEGLMKAFGLSSSVRLGELPDFLATEVYGFVWLFVALALALSCGTGAVSAEVGSGTLGSWLSAGLSRSRYLFAHWLHFLIQATLLILGTNLGIALGASLQNEAVPWSSLWAASVQGAIFALACYALACACSTLYSERGPALRLALLVIALSYCQWVLGGLWSRGDVLVRFTLFHLFEPLPLLRSGQIDGASAISGIALALLLLGFSYWRFRARDLALG